MTFLNVYVISGKRSTSGQQSKHEDIRFATRKMSTPYCYYTAGTPPPQKNSRGKPSFSVKRRVGTRKWCARRVCTDSRIKSRNATGMISTVVTDIQYTTYNEYSGNSACIVRVMRFILLPPLGRPWYSISGANYGSGCDGTVRACRSRRRENLAVILATVRVYVGWIEYVRRRYSARARPVRTQRLKTRSCRCRTTCREIRIFRFSRNGVSQNGSFL